MRLNDLVAASDRITAAAGRLEKARHLAELLRRLAADEITIAISYLSGYSCQGRIGIGVSKLLQMRQHPADPTLTLRDIDSLFQQIADAAGTGSATVRRDLLAALFAQAVKF